MFPLRALACTHLVYYTPITILLLAKQFIRVNSPNIIPAKLSHYTVLLIAKFRHN